MKRLVLGMAVALSACTGGPPPPSAAVATAQPTAGPPLGHAGELLVVHLLDDPGPFFDVRVDAVQPTGGWQTVATFEDVAPVGWTLAAPTFDGFASIGPSGHVVLHVERDGGVDDLARRTVILDPREPGAAPYEIAGHVDPIWMPDGRVSWVSTLVQIADLRTGNPPETLEIARPSAVDVFRASTADGTGWLAARQDEDGDVEAVGVMTAAGTFVPGLRPAFESRGLERPFGAQGGTLGYAVADGVGQSETVLLERRSDLPRACQCLAWVRQVEPGDDPGFGEGVWDARGAGIWVPMAESDGPGRWLSHVTVPGKDDRVADLPAGVDWRIVGLSPDDTSIVLLAPERGEVLVVDTVAGTTSVVARRAGGELSGPIFAGWVR